MRAVRTIALMILIPLGGMAQLPQRDTRPTTPTGDSAISGRVMTSEGRPLARVRVMLRLAGGDPGQRITVINGVVSGPNFWQAVTDNTGQFSFPNIPAGTYTLTGSHTQYLPIQYGQRYLGQPGRPIELAAGERLRADLVAVRGTAITGRVFDENSDPLQDVSVTAYRYVVQGERKILTPVGGRSYASNDIGQYRIANLAPGDYLVAATYRGMPDMSPDATVKQGYAPTWYPGSIAPSGAQVVRVMPGTDSMNIDFVLQPTRLVQASGRIVTASGTSANNTQMWVTPVDGEVVSATRPTARVMGDGAFVVPDLTPGEYLFTAQYSPRIENAGGGNRGAVPQMPPMPGRGAPVPPRALEYASLRVSVGHQPIDNLMIQLRPGTRLAVRVQSDVPLASRRTLQLLTDDQLSNSQASPLSEANEAVFIVAPGRYRPAVALPEGWVIEKITADGRDVTGTGIPVAGESSITVAMQITSRGATLTGTVAAGPSGMPADYTLVALPDNPEERTAAAGGVKIARPDQTGRFTLKGLRAGSYYVGAVGYADPNELYDPAFWARIEPNAIRVSLTTGEMKAITAPFISRR